MGPLGGDRGDGVRDLRRDVEELRRVTARCSEEMAAVLDCLADANVLSRPRFHVTLHRRHFEQTLRLHGRPALARWEDVLGTKEIIFGVGQHTGPLGVRSICTLSRAISSALGPVLRSVIELYPGDLYVAGGSRDGVQGGLSTAERFDPRAVCWEAISPMAERREFASAGVVDGRVYVCGGRAGTQPLSSVERFDPTSGWEPVAAMLSARAGASAAVVAGRLYVCGGWKGTHFFRTAERFDASAGFWEHSPPMAERRGDPAAAAVCGRVYVCGGYDGVQQLCSVECCRPGGRWEEAPPMLERRMGLVAASIGNCLYVCGGSSGTQALSSLECLDTEVQRWESLQPMSAGRFCAAAGAAAGSLYVFGGMLAGRCLSSAERFDPASGTWLPLPPMSERRTGGTVATALR